MKITELLKIVDKGWVRKPKGFRVRYQKQTGSELTTDFIPPEDSAPLDSDVVAWRAAWKLAQSTNIGSSDTGQGEIINICVVDDANNPVKYYATNRMETFNQLTSEDELH